MDTNNQGKWGKKDTMGLLIILFLILAPLFVWYMSGRYGRCETACFDALGSGASCSDRYNRFKQYGGCAECVVECVRKYK